MSDSKNKRITGNVGGLFRFWKVVKSVSVSEIANEAERSIHVACIGEPHTVDRLISRLSRDYLSQPSLPGAGSNSPDLKHDLVGISDIRPYIGEYLDKSDVPGGAVIINASIIDQGEDKLAELLARIVMAHPEIRLSLARHIPAFRPAVSAQLINEVSWVNAKMAVLSALPGILPITDILLPAASVGDMIILTKNQVMMLLRIAAAYGLPVQIRSRLRELLPVVGGAFGWRAVARELIGLVPGGIGVVVKGAVAYAGTYTVGKAAVIYYSTGRTLPKPRLKKLYLDAYNTAINRLKQIWQRGRTKSALVSNIEAEGANQSAEAAAFIDTDQQKYANINKINKENTGIVDKPVNLGV